MKFALRLCLALIVSATAFLAAPVTPASGTPANCSSTTCVTLTGAAVVGSPDVIYEFDYHFSFTNDAPLTSAVFTAALDRRLTSDAKVTVDHGTPVDAIPGAGGHGLTLDLASGGPLATGRHSIAFTVHPTTEAATDTEPNWISSGALAFAVDGGNSATAASGDVVQLANGEPWMLDVIPSPTAHEVLVGAPTSFDVRLTRRDTSTAQRALLFAHTYGGIDVSSLRIFNGTGVLLGQDGDALECDPPSETGEVQCLTPTIPIGVASADFEVMSFVDHDPGPHLATGVGIFAFASVGVRVGPSETANYVSPDVDVVNEYNLSGSIVPSGPTTLGVGKPRQFVVTVKNNSSDVVQPAIGLFAPVVDPGPAGSTVNADNWADISVEPSHDDVAAVYSDAVLWQPTLAPRSSETLTLTITARIAGVTTALGLADISRADDSGCTDATCTLLAQSFLITSDGTTPVVRPSTGAHVTGLTDGRGNTLDGNPTLARGGVLKVSLTGFAPHANVQVTLHSAVRDLGTVKADASGRISYVLTVPQDLELGAHTLTFTSGSVHTSVMFSVAEATLASTGATPRLALVAGLLSVLLGFGLVLASRRRRGMLGD